MDVIPNTIVPVFAVIGIGYGLAWRGGLDVQTLSDIALLVTSPALLFSVLSGADVDLAQWGSLAGGTAFVAAGTALGISLYVRLLATGRRGLVLPAVFWNAGNMGLACSRLAFGPEGLEAASIVFVTMAILNASFGIWIAKGENGLAEALRLPLLHASVGGVAVALAGIEIPRMAMEPIRMVGAMAIPLMLLNLGMQLRGLRVTDLRHSLVAVAVRMGGGLVLGLSFAALAGVGGVDRQVLVLQASMPAAVINSVMAQRYRTDPALVASSIVLSTLASLVGIPFVLWLVA